MGLQPGCSARGLQPARCAVAASTLCGCSLRAARLQVLQGETGKPTKRAGPSTPVRVSGFREANPNPNPSPSPNPNPNPHQVPGLGFPLSSEFNRTKGEERLWVIGNSGWYARTLP